MTDPRNRSTNVPHCVAMAHRLEGPAHGFGSPTFFWTFAAFIAAWLLTGCDRPRRPLEFEPNLVHALKHEIKEGVPTTQAAADAFWIVTEMFGTPESPKLPSVVTEDEDLASVVSMDRIIAASGSPDSQGRGLYQKHCASCHGVTGDGRGENAAIAMPYPRDYRKGVFKFKSTQRGAKPTREDLADLIRHGVPGTVMVAIPELARDDEAIEALVDYVIFLSWRGELERALLDDAIFELDLGGGDRIIDPTGRASDDEEAVEAFEESWSIAEDFAVEIAEAWLDAEDSVVTVPEVSSDIPVTDSYAEFAELSRGDDAAKLIASVARGKELFNGKIASCSKCHGESGRGDGQTTDYDDWTKDWTLAAGIKPEDRDALIPLLARGAMAPMNAKPRDFSSGVFHGGASAPDLYRRIMVGIEGSPMPAATLVEGQFEQDDVWHLINYIRSLQAS